jgi:hypothetical protein
LTQAHRVRYLKNDAFSPNEAPVSLFPGAPLRNPVNFDRRPLSLEFCTAAGFCVPAHQKRIHFF